MPGNCRILEILYIPTDNFTAAGTVPDFTGFPIF
jgi:hypothetical protein